MEPSQTDREAYFTLPYSRVREHLDVRMQGELVLIDFGGSMMLWLRTPAQAQALIDAAIKAWDILISHAPPLVHYASGSGVTCGTDDWQFQARDPKLVTCEACKASPVAAEPAEPAGEPA